VRPVHESQNVCTNGFVLLCMCVASCAPFSVTVESPPTHRYMGNRMCSSRPNFHSSPVCVVPLPVISRSRYFNIPKTVSRFLGTSSWWICCLYWTIFYAEKAMHESLNIGTRCEKGA